MTDKFDSADVVPVSGVVQGVDGQPPESIPAHDSAPDRDGTPVPAVKVRLGPKGGKSRNKGNLHAAYGVKGNTYPGAAADAQRQRERDARTTGEAVRAILDHYGVGNNPPSKEVGWLYRSTRVVLQRLQRVQEKAPDTKQAGALADETKAYVGQLVSAINALERLLKICADNAPERPVNVDTHHSVFLLSGAPLPPGVRPCATCGAFELPMASTGSPVPPIFDAAETDVRPSASAFLEFSAEKEPAQ